MNCSARRLRARCERCTINYTRPPDVRGAYRLVQYVLATRKGGAPRQKLEDSPLREENLAATLTRAPDPSPIPPTLVNLVGLLFRCAKR